MICRIVFAPEARDELDRLHGLIPDAADADIASRSRNPPLDRHGRNWAHLVCDKPRVIARARGRQEAHIKKSLYVLDEHPVSGRCSRGRGSPAGLFGPELRREAGLKPALPPQL